MARFRCLSVTSHITCIVARLLILSSSSLRTHVELLGMSRDFVPDSKGKAWSTFSLRKNASGNALC